MDILNNPFPDALSVYLEETPSTMIAARELIKQNPPDGSVVYTDFQTNGRGRIQGRRWEGEKGQSMLCTVLFKTSIIPFAISMFPLFAGYTLACCLKDNYHICAYIKWPNDLLVEGCKISGILCECADNYISCGIGVNMLQTDFPDSFRRKGCSIKTISGIYPCRDELLEQLLISFRKNLTDKGWRSKFESILYRRGELVTVSDGLAEQGSDLTGILIGIGDNGQLLIKNSAGQTAEIYAGEMKF